MSLEALICDTEAQMQMCVHTFISGSQKFSVIPPPKKVHPPTLATDEWGSEMNVIERKVTS